MDYLLLKTLHILGVVLFVGNIIVTALWKSIADRSDQPAVVAFGPRLVLLADAVFTLPGVILILVTGLAMAGGHQGIFSKTWLAWGFSLFVITGLLWLLVLIPVQLRQASLAKNIVAAGTVPAFYRRLERLWAVVGIAATILPLIILYLMVMKPT